MIHNEEIVQNEYSDSLAPFSRSRLLSKAYEQ